MKPAPILSAISDPVAQIRQLAPFILLAMLLHLVLLSALHPPAGNTVAVQPLEVYLSAPPIAEPERTPDKSPGKKSVKPPNLSQPPLTPLTPQFVRHETISPVNTPASFNSRRLMESARDIAQDEAIKTERHIAAQEQKKLNTPVASLEKYLRQPHQEVRLANGDLKIITDAGAVCFQAVPYFARDMLGIFGIPMACP